jgi:hypothetical protein
MGLNEKLREASARLNAQKKKKPLLKPLPRTALPTRTAPMNWFTWARDGVFHLHRVGRSFVCGAVAPEYAKLTWKQVDPSDAALCPDCKLNTHKVQKPLPLGAGWVSVPQPPLVRCPSCPTKLKATNLPEHLCHCPGLGLDPSRSPNKLGVWLCDPSDVRWHHVNYNNDSVFACGAPVPSSVDTDNACKVPPGEICKDCRRARIKFTPSPEDQALRNPPPKPSYSIDCPKCGFKTTISQLDRHVSQCNGGPFVAECNIVTCSGCRRKITRGKQGLAYDVKNGRRQGLHLCAGDADQYYGTLGVQGGLPFTDRRKH